MSTCKNCGVNYPDGLNFCEKCGLPLEGGSVENPADKQDMPTGCDNCENVTPQNQNAELYELNAKPTYVFSIIGFVISIIGIFWFAPVLLPLSIILCIIGFTEKSCRGLAIAGFTISIIGIAIKAALVLNMIGALPSWISSGVF